MLAAVLFSSSTKRNYESGYFEHYLLLVAGMHILVSDSISQSELNLAEKFLNLFYLHYSDLYDK